MDGKAVLEKRKRVEEALKKIEGGASLRSISKEYDIPRSTLYDKLHGKTSRTCVLKTELTLEEEEGLVKWVKGMNERGFGRNKTTIINQVKKILDAQGRTTRFKNNLPGKDWYYAFLKRWSGELTCKTPMQLSNRRALVTPGMVYGWSGDLERFLNNVVNDPTLWDEPDRWFSAEETSFPLCPKSGKVVCAKDATHVYNFSTSDKSVITVMACLSAGGAYCQPMIVFSGTQFNFFPLHGFESAAFGRSQNGWMDSELFSSWLKKVFIVFLEEKNIKRPVVLLVDGHKTHLTMEASDICSDNGVVLYCLLKNASHLLQPCDLWFFSSLNSSWKKAVASFLDDNPGEIVTKRTFAKVFCLAWKEASKPEHASGAFQDCGLFPFNPAKVADSRKLAPCQLFVTQHTSSSTASEATTFEVPLASTAPATASEVPPTPFIPAQSPTQFPSSFNFLQRPSTHGLTSSLLKALDLSMFNSFPVNSVNCGRSTCPCKCHSDFLISPSQPGTSTNQLGTFTSQPGTSASQPSTSASQPSTSSSASFTDIPFPQVRITKASKTTEKLPKAATGEVFRKMLEEKCKRKERKRKAAEKKQRKAEEKRQKRQRENGLFEEVTQEIDDSDNDLGPIDVYN